MQPYHVFQYRIKTTTSNNERFLFFHPWREVKPPSIQTLIIMAWYSVLGGIAARIGQRLSRSNQQKQVQQQLTEQARQKASKAAAGKQATASESKMSKAKGQADSIKPQLSKQVKLEKTDGPKGPSSTPQSNNNTSSSSSYTPRGRPYTPPKGRGRSR